MVGVVIATHGILADSLLAVTELIIGKQDNVVTIAFNLGQSSDDLQADILSAIGSVDNGDGVLIITDLFAGSPYNAAAMIAMSQANIEVLSGVNLPMLLKSLPKRSQSLAKVAEFALQGGQEGIRRILI